MSKLNGIAAVTLVPTGGYAPPSIAQVRPEVALFAVALEERLREHDPEKGDTWRECAMLADDDETGAAPWLTAIALNEMAEFQDACVGNYTPKERAAALESESLDVAACVMFVWAKASGLVK